jgi:hypothetical protein
MDEFMDTPQRTPEELRMSLENIDRQLIEVEAEKKAAAKGYNERIKDLKAERDAIIEQLGQ